MVRLGLFMHAFAAVAMVWAVAAGRAHACGGLFCNQSNPVNQAAERILFVDNGDGTVTAVIEIQYEGPSQSFSWVLPVPGVPDVGVSSTAAFDILQQRTNPQYMLQTSLDDSCAGTNNTRSLAAGAAPPSGADAVHSGVSVVAQGSVGPYDYEVIKVDPELPQPEDAALQWLMDNGYDVTSLGPEVLHPYLADGENLLAFRLSKDSDTGSIRPVVITYEADLPDIPIRPTAVAANDDMGVMVWVAAKSRAIPKNYKALELNEALIDWFQPMTTYDAVVSAAADEAGGQGFVTEMATPTYMFQGVIVQDFNAQQWQTISSGQFQFTDAADLISTTLRDFGSWDGFVDALQAALSLPQGVTAQDVLNCPACYQDDPDFALDEDAFIKALYEQVYKPMADTEKLLLSQPYVTRLYTTMSADEMTLDPAFDFNADLGDVSNVHTAEQVMGCDGSWRVTLPQGGTVYGNEPGTWPNMLGGDQPAARKILQLATQGKGEVMVDNSDMIAKLLLRAAADHDGGVSLSPSDADAGAGSLSGTGDDCGCSVPGVRSGRGRGLCCVWLLGCAGLGLWRRRRRS